MNYDDKFCLGGYSSSPEKPPAHRNHHSTLSNHRPLGIALDAKLVVSPRLADVDFSLGNGPDFGRPINSMPRETSILQNRGSTRVLKIFLKEYRGERFSPRSIGRSGKWSLRYSSIYPNVRLLLARPLMYQDLYWFIGDDGKCIVRPSFGVFHRWSQHRFCGAQVLCLIWSYMGFACSWWLSCRCCQKYVQYP